MVMPVFTRSPEASYQLQTQEDKYMRVCGSCWGCTEALPRVLCLLDRGGNHKAIVEQVRGASAEARLYILIHNIDGPGTQANTLCAASHALLTSRRHLSAAIGRRLDQHLLSSHRPP